MVIYNTKDAKITYDTENKVLVQTIHNHLNSLREFQTEFINIYQSLNVSKIILSKDRRIAVERIVTKIHE